MKIPTDAQTHYDMNRVLSKLADRIGTHRYGHGRYGTIPPEAMAEAADDVKSAHATIKAIATDASGPSPSQAERWLS